ncbi:MAG: c-type cytochrome [Gaiellaceae bacterium]
MAPRKRRNPWTSTGEVLIWILFVVLLLPAGFAGWAVGHYTSLGTKPPATVTVNVGGTVSTPTTTTAATTTSSGGGQVAAGKTLFASSGCSTCHTFTPAGSNGTIGPNLDTAPAQDAKADGNMDLSAFIKQSITDPGAYIAQGFKAPSVMPTTFGSLKPSQLDDLVAFILSGSK